MSLRALVRSRLSYAYHWKVVDEAGAIIEVGVASDKVRAIASANRALYRLRLIHGKGQWTDCEYAAVGKEKT